nr:MAG TPA: hypothetical protein [Caudoviricetes sp.]
MVVEQPEAQRSAICMAHASDFIQHGEGIFGLSGSGNYTDEFGALISSVNYSWSAKGDAELVGENGVMVGKTIFDSRCEITWEAYRRKAGTTIPHIGEVVDVNAEVLNLCIKNAGEEIPDTVGKAICTGIDVKMERAGYMSFTVKALYSPNIAALNPQISSE